MLPCRKILCAVDFSDCSRRALEVAADLSKTLDADLTMVHVYDEAVLASAAIPAETHEQLAHDAEQTLSTWRQSAEERSRRRVNVVLARGEPGDRIAHLSDSFDLVVVGTHGRTGIRRAILGSVAERVVRHASCNVLVARPAPWLGD
jgi:nucleotide-binding universal stress UspA family protein